MSFSDLERTFLSASKETRMLGEGWYSEAHLFAEKLSARRLISVPQACGIIAVLSPLVEWEGNKFDAEHLIMALQNKKTFRPRTYRNNVLKAKDILKHNALECIKGLKVTAFFDNLLNPKTSTRVTLDRHMLRLIMDGDEREVKRVFDSPKRYLGLEEDFRALAATYDIKPLQMQATIWLEIKK